MFIRARHFFLPQARSIQYTPPSYFLKIYSCISSHRHRRLPRRFTHQTHVCNCSFPHTSLCAVRMNIQFPTLSIFLIAKCPQGEIGTNKKLIYGIALRLNEGTREGQAFLKTVSHFPVLQIGPSRPAGTDLLHVLNWSRIFKALVLEPPAVATGVHH